MGERVAGAKLLIEMLWSYSFSQVHHSYPVVCNMVAAFEAVCERASIEGVDCGTHVVNDNAGLASLYTFSV